MIQFSSARRARTIVAIENFGRCLAEFASAPNAEHDEYTTDALAERMEREVEQASKARAHERLADMRAIGRSAGMDS